MSLEQSGTLVAVMMSILGFISCIISLFDDRNGPLPFICWLSGAAFVGCLWLLQ